MKRLVVEVRKREENREKYRDSKNIAEERYPTRRKGAPRTLGMEKKKEEKRCGTRHMAYGSPSIVRWCAARGARSRVRTGPCTIQIYVYAARCTCINRTHAQERSRLRMYLRNSEVLLVHARACVRRLHHKRTTDQTGIQSQRREERKRGNKTRCDRRRRQKEGWQKREQARA